MKIKEIEDFILGFEGSVMVNAADHDRSRFKIKNKLFAETGANRDGVNFVTVKMSPELNMAMRNSYDSVIEGYFSQKNRWSSILLTGEVPEHHIKMMIRVSYSAALAASGLTQQQ